MDKTDVKIIEILQIDGRISMKELGLEVGLTPPAVAERVKRLEENNIIVGYKAVINPDKLDRSFQVLINLAMKVDKHKKFLKFANERDSIVHCDHVTGPHCMIIRAILDDMQSLENLVNELQVFGDTETFIILSSPIKNKVIVPLKNFKEYKLEK